MTAGGLGRSVGVASFLALVLVGAGCEDIRARKLVQEGNDLYRAGDFKKAVAKYDEATQIRPALGVAHINRAYSYLLQFTPGVKTPENAAAAEGAIVSYKKFLELNPDRKDVRDLLIQLWLDSGHHDDALGYFKGVLDKDPKNMEAIKTIGVIHSKAGNFTDALEWYGKRASIEPSNPEAHYAIGALVWDYLHTHPQLTGEERLQIADKGIEALAQAFKLNDKYADAYSMTNLIYRERAHGHGDTTHPTTGPAASAAALEDIKKAEEFMKKDQELKKTAQAQAAPAPGKK